MIVLFLLIYIVRHILFKYFEFLGLNKNFHFFKFENLKFDDTVRAKHPRLFLRCSSIVFVTGSTPS
jgi:hypothetical protein